MSNLCPSDSILNQDAQASALWEKLCQLSMDRGTGPRTFATRLAREQGWSASFTALAIGEYRRFLLLFALDQRGRPETPDRTAVRIVPSPVVDKVWHLHLLYTQSYWEDLCRDILGGPLHHLPADGSGGEETALEAVYRHTLETYRQTFGQTVPGAIWPPATRPAALEAPRPRRAKGEMAVVGTMAFIPFLLIATRIFGRSFLPALFFAVVMAVMIVLMVCFARRQTSATRRHLGFFDASSDAGGFFASGSSSGDADGSTHHAGGHHGGGHDAGGHSHSCGGGHGCGGHGCGGH